MTKGNRNKGDRGHGEVGSWRGGVTEIFPAGLGLKSIILSLAVTSKSRLKTVLKCLLSNLKVWSVTCGLIYDF